MLELAHVCTHIHTYQITWSPKLSLTGISKVGKHTWLVFTQRISKTRLFMCITVISFRISQDGCGQHSKTRYITDSRGKLDPPIKSTLLYLFIVFGLRMTFQEPKRRSQRKSCFWCPGGKAVSDVHRCCHCSMTHLCSPKGRNLWHPWCFLLRMSLQG